MANPSPVDIIEHHRLQAPSILKLNSPWSCRGCDWTSNSLNGERAHAEHLVKSLSEAGLVFMDVKKIYKEE